MEFMWVCPLHHFHALNRKTWSSCGHMIHTHELDPHAFDSTISHRVMVPSLDKSFGGLLAPAWSEAGAGLSPDRWMILGCFSKRDSVVQWVSGVLPKADLVVLPIYAENILPEPRRRKESKFLNISHVPQWILSMWTRTTELFGGGVDPLQSSSWRRVVHEFISSSFSRTSSFRP